MRRIILTGILIGIALLVLYSPALLAAHSDCSDYCYGDQECHLGIETSHDKIGGCTNYGYTSAGRVTLGEHCRNTTGLKAWTVNTMDCVAGGPCHVTGSLRCPTGSFPLDDSTTTCWPPDGGWMKLEATKSYVSCFRSNGTGFYISCADSGGLVISTY